MHHHHIHIETDIPHVCTCTIDNGRVYADSYMIDKLIDRHIKR